MTDDRTADTIGFIGLGVMGEPMCRHLAQKCGRRVLGSDLSPEPLHRLAAYGVEAAASVASLAQDADLVFLSLPDGGAVEAVCLGPDGLVGTLTSGKTVVDLGTTPAATSRKLAKALGEAGIRFADAPVARTRQAAEDGRLCVMVGAEPAVFEAIRPFLACFATDIVHCGGVGAGEVVKQMNNMVLFQTVLALAEALTVARRSGVEGKVLFDTLAMGSADSFALRNHGMKALLPGEFPERAFPTDYALKDLGYALDLAREAGLTLPGAENAKRVLESASAAGYGAQYFPALIKVIEDGKK